MSSELQATPGPSDSISPVSKKRSSSEVLSDVEARSLKKLKAESHSKSPNKDKRKRRKRKRKMPIVASAEERPRSKSASAVSTRSISVKPAADAVGDTSGPVAVQPNVSTVLFLSYNCQL